MHPPQFPVSGQPRPGEIAAYAAEDIAFVPGEDVVAALKELTETTLRLLATIPETFGESFRYAPGKWTLKQVLGHLVDDERIFGYRILCIARGDMTPLPGFDENLCVRTTCFEARPWADLLAEYRTVRNATLSLLRTFTPESWTRLGTVNGFAASARGLAFHVVGHELHHLRVIRDNYLPALP